MSRYRLTYFDFDGGRGEAIRIAFHAAGVDFEDNRLSFPEFGELQSSLPFHAVPVLEIDGAPVTQSNALCRYVGKMAGLYPEDDLQALYCDEALGAIEDIDHYIVQTFGLQGEELQQARKELIDRHLSVYLRGLDELLTRGGGQYFADSQLTIADLKVCVEMISLGSGHLDHVPTDLVEQFAPGLKSHRERISADPRVVAYYAMRS